MKSKKNYVVFIIILVLFFCAFNTDAQKKPEETDYIMSVLFDIDDEEIKVMFESPVLKKDEAQAVLYGEQKVTEFKIAHFQDFCNEYVKNVSKYPDLQHLKVLLIGENLLNDKEKFAEFIDFLHAQNEFLENVYVTVDASNGEILKNEEESAGSYLENLFVERNKTNQQMSSTVGKLLAASCNENLALYIPCISNDKKIEGEWVIACKKAISYMKEDTAKWFLEANCVDCECELYFQDVYDETLDEKDNFSIEISKIERQVSFNENNGKVNAHIVLKLNGKIKNYCGEVITDAAGQISKEELLSVCLSQKYENLAEFSKGKDLFNTYYELSNRNRTIWKKYKNSYENYVKNLNVDIIVETDFNN